MTPIGAARCVCGCPPAVHEHYRPGTDCGSCGDAVCPMYDAGRGGPHSSPWAGIGLAFAVQGVVLAIFATAVFGGTNGLMAVGIFTVVVIAAVLVRCR